MAALAAASPSGDECAEEEEDELEPGLEEAEPEPGSAARAAGGSRGAVLTRRGITLRVLLRDGLLEPGCGVLSIYYLGKKFVGDLGADGAITWQETGQVFGSPSAWATHCKRLVNPAKKSGCGWASVRYKGQRLDQYKAAWLRRHQPHVHSEEALPSEGEEDELPEEEEEEVGDGRTPAAEPAVSRRTEERSRKPPGRSAAEQEPPLGKRPESRARAAVRYCTLGTRDAARSPQTLVEVTSFAAINKFQPFNVAISSNVLLLLDFHSHLTRSEVVGYLGGRWDTNTQLLTVLHAFPCRSRLGDAEAAGAVEEEICQSLFLRGLSLVGWYHSHPFGPALPSLHDIDTQMDYQLKLQGSGNGFQPCLALICGPYYAGNPGVESKIAPFWVMPPPEQRPNDYGIPMDVEVAYIQDGFLTNDVLQEMTLLVEFYRGAPDLVKFQELWSHDQTYLDKLKLLSAGLPGLPHPQGSELRPHPGADLRPAEAQQLSRSCAGEQRLRAALQGCSTACCAQRANGRTQSQQRGARGQSRVGGLLGAQRLQCDRVWGNKGGNAASPLTQTGMGSRPSAPELQAERLHSMPTLPKTAGRRDRLFAINCFYCCGKWNVSLTETSMPTKNTFITKRGNQSAELIERLATMWQQQPCFSVIANSS
ncbi:MPN domain-containing protein isoform X2 [Gallus gallus]|uniref:MPN domain-containing protein isoform X2 n=1 Tax=Gallus gallus TaxID=9031 RepID=UPI001AE664A5|nr:MPN domain-containing protein isoform X2 [Gallus gallus]